MTPLPPIDRFGDANPSDTQRAPSDYAPRNRVRGPKHSTVLMRARWVQVIETGEIFCALRFGFAKEKLGGDKWMALMEDMQPLWPLDPSDIQWPAPDWPIDEDGRGLSWMEYEAMNKSTRAAA